MPDAKFAVLLLKSHILNCSVVIFQIQSYCSVISWCQSSILLWNSLKSKRKILGRIGTQSRIQYVTVSVTTFGVWCLVATNTAKSCVSLSSVTRKYDLMKQVFPWVREGFWQMNFKMIMINPPPRPVDAEHKVNLKLSPCLTKHLAMKTCLLLN
jgi:hypothetical protein